jgi:Domain of unknown function (DUF4412)
MNPIRLAGISLLATALASPALADVTLKSKGSAAGLVGGMAGDMTQYLKGLKMRTDQTSGQGRRTTTIIDIAARQMIVLNNDTKEAEVIDMTSLSESLSKIGASDITSSITPTGQTRTVAGQSCTVHDLKIMVPMQMGQQKMSMVMSGPQCLVKNGPGQADFQAFYRAAADKGGFLDATQARTRPAAAKAMTDMYRQMSELGVPFVSEMKMSIDGTGPMAEAMKKMGSTITTEVVEVSTAPIPAAMFEVPADYKVTKR